jgi:hypothetical protein
MLDLKSCDDHVRVVLRGAIVKGKGTTCALMFAPENETYFIGGAAAAEMHVVKSGGIAAAGGTAQAADSVAEEAFMLPRQVLWDNVPVASLDEYRLKVSALRSDEIMLLQVFVGDGARIEIEVHPRQKIFDALG